MKTYNKDRLRSASRRYKADISGIIYNSLVHDVPKHKVYGLIKREIAYFAKESDGLSFKNKGLLWSTSVKLYSLCSKQAYLGLKNSKKASTYQERVKMRSESAFEAVKNNLIIGWLLPKALLSVENRLESDYKDAQIDEMLSSETERVFYLCDMHEPCASDHAKWQGKLYIRKDWEEMISDVVLGAKIQAYLHNHPDVRTVEWALGLDGSKDSPYLMRRPNCKHQLVPISTEDVLGSSVKKLLIKEKLIKKHERDSYNDPVRYYRAYKDRLETLRDLWDIAPSEKLGKEISETNRDMKKWARLVNRA